MNSSKHCRFFRSIPLAIVMTFFVLPVMLQTGCNKAEQAGDAVKDAASQAGDTVADAGKMASDGFSAAAKKASSAMEGIDGGTEMLTKVKDFFGSAQSTLSGITDKASAEAAVSSLGDLDGAVDSLGKLTGNLPASAKTALGTVIDQGVKQLKTLVDKVVALPGVSEVIKPKMDEIIKKLMALTK